MWACLNKTCPCLPFKSSKPPFDPYYEDEDNREFESLLAGQNSERIAEFLSRAPFQRSANSQEYLRISNMVTPNEETSASTEHVDNLLDDEDNLQTQDAQFLPDEQINKITELISEQTRHDQITDAQLAAEEEEARRLEEEDYERKRQAATEAALAKGLITSEQANNKNGFFSIDDDDDDDDDDGVTDSSRTVYSMNLDGGSSVELAATASQRNTSIYEEEQNASSLNKPRNPLERFVVSDINEEDYDDVTDFEDSPPTNSKDQTTIDDPLTRYSVAAQDEA